MSSRISRIICCLVLSSTATVLMAAEVASAPQPDGIVRAIRVLPDKAPDCSSLKSIALSVTRDCKTNDERAIAIYNFMILAHYHRQYPSEPGGVPVLKEINAYGWSLCGGLHSEESALWRELGWDWRFVGWNGHTTVEANYDGRWHYLDAFLKFYAWMPDANAPGGRTIAGEDDLNNNAQKLIADAFVLDKGRAAVYAKDNRFEIVGEKANWTAPALLSCGDTIADVIGGLKTHKPAGRQDGWAGINHATGNYSADVNLAPGFALTNTWEAVADGWYWAGSKVAPAHTCGNKDLRNSPDAGLVMEPYNQHVRSFTNGTLIFAPDFASDGVLRSFAASANVRFAGGALVPAQAGSPASVTVLLQSPYIMTKATGTAEGADSVEVSIDGGKSFKPADVKDFTAAVKGQVIALVRVNFATALKSLRLEALVQNNPGSLPYLSPGKNTVSVSAADAKALGENKLVVTYAYCPGYRSKSFEQLCDEGKEVAKQHNATWAETPTVVQKTFAATDLPAKFDIDIPTPKDKHPVYPRMLFVRREVIAPAAKPLPLPANAQEPKTGANDELKTLPNPFLMGSQPPPARIVRPTRTATIELKPGHFVTRAGDVPATDFIKWPKNANEKIEPMAFLIGGEVTGLPALKDLAGARLVFPAIRAHEQAATQVGVVNLKTAFEPGAKYDFANFGDVLGTVVVPKQGKDAPDWNPPKEFTIDITRYIRSLAMGEAKFQGFALRVVPERGIDDGWTVRINLPKQPRVYIEINTFQ
ncbi:MAG: hypothetical protein ABSH20_00570 [Tepidisphaeraceae bacterium]